MAQKKFYAVVKGKKPGIYHEWFGVNGADEQVSGFSGAVYKSFKTVVEAEQWYNRAKDAYSGDKSSDTIDNALPEPEKNINSQPSLLAVSEQSKEQLTNVTIYTDGACIKNPGAGGYGVVLLHGQHRKELSGGFRLTTNNRMEIMAAIVGLQALKTKCAVTVYSDSRYVVDAIMLGWVEKWRANGWKRTKTELASNSDLWELLFQLCLKHEVKFVWVKGHAGNPGNERCDALSVQAAQMNNLPADTQYESEQNV